MVVREKIEDQQIETKISVKAVKLCLTPSQRLSRDEAISHFRAFGESVATMTLAMQQCLNS